MLEIQGIFLLQRILDYTKYSHRLYVNSVVKIEINI